MSIGYKCIKNFSKGAFPEHQGCLRFKEVLDKEYRYWFLSQEKITPEILDHAFHFQRIDPTKRVSEKKWPFFKKPRNRIRFQIIDNELYIVKPSHLHSREKKWVEILQTLLRYVYLSDTDFIINLIDEPCIHKYSCLPIFSVCKTDSHEDLLLPNFFGPQTFTDPYLWEQKRNKCIWRGSTTGGEFFYGCWKKYPRSLLVRLKTEHPDIDVSYTSYVQHDVMTLSLMQKSEPLGNYMPMKDQCLYKYFVQVDGNTTAWRFIDLLGSNSVVFKQQSPFYEFYYPLLKPNEHYIPIGPYCEDLPQKIEWAKANDLEVKKIAENASRLVRENLTIYDYYCYLWNTLTLYTQLLGFEVSVHGKAKKV